MVDASLIAIRMRLTGGSQVAAEAKSANAAIAETGAAAKTAGAQSASASARIAKTATSLKTVGTGLSKYVTLPLLGVAAVSGKMALDFDRNMRNVNSIAQLPEKRFDALKQKVLDLAGPTAQAPNTLAEGLYDLVSSGFDASESVSILKKSALAASAGLTTTEVSTKAVAAALNAYHLKARAAGGVSDTLFETVNRGVLTFDQLSTSIGDALPFAAQLGVGLNQVGAAISTMTKQGLSAPESVTRLKNVMVTLIKPGKALEMALKSMNTTGADLVKKEGLQGALEAIIGTTDGSKESLAALFPNIRALGGVLALTGKSAKTANEDLAAFQNTTGATAKVLHEQEKSFGFQMQRAWSSLQAVLIEIGTEVLPIVIPPFLQLVHAVKDGISWFSALPGPIKRIGGELLVLAAMAGPLLLFAGAMAKAALAVKALFAVQAGGEAVAGSAGLFAGAGPAMAFIAVLGLEVAAFTILYKKVKWFHNAVDVIWKVAGNQLLFLVAPLVELVLHFDLLKNAASSAAGFLSGAFSAAIQWTGNAVGNTAAFFEALPGRIGGALAKVPGIIWGALKQTPAMLGRFIGFWLGLPFRVGYIMVRLGLRVEGALGRLRDRLPGLAARAMVALLSGFLHTAPEIFQFIIALDTRIYGFLARLPGKMLGLGGRIISFLLRGLIHGAGALWAWEASLPGKFLGFVGRIAPQMFQVGKSIASQIAHGLAQGLTDMLPGPVKNALGAVGGAAGDVGGFIGGAFALGTNSAPGGLALVGETGPEIVNLPVRSQVIPAPRTRRLLTGKETSPRPAALAQRMRGAGGGARFLAPITLKVGKRVLTEVVVETQEDAEARL